MKKYDVTLYYWKSVVVEANDVAEAIEKAHCGYGEEESGLNPCSDMDEAWICDDGEEEKI